MSNTAYIVDLETHVNMIMFCFLHYDHKQDERHHFILWKDQDDREALYTFLHKNLDNQERHVTYNGLNFDSQIIQWIIDREDYFSDPLLDITEVVNEIYGYAQYCINKSNKREFMDYAPWHLQIPQLDLMQMGHWGPDGPKPASLKWLQCSMDWHNIEDSPYHHTFYIEDREQLNQVLTYCYNDCEATKKVLYLAKDAVRLRKSLSEEYGIDLWSASEPKIAKDLLLHFLSKRTGKDKKELKRWSTQRDTICVKDLILPYIKFERQEFIMLLNNFKKLTVRGDSLRGAFSYTVKYRGMEIEYGVGGLHATTEKGVYESNEDYVIKSVDVSSFYPNLCISSGWAPAHLNKQMFTEQYAWLYTERQKYPKGNAKNKALKIVLNSIFGLSIDKFSYLHDPAVGVAITINGQLLLSMLIEMICERIPDAKPLVANTDGTEILIHKQYDSLFSQICKEWEGLTNLILEHDKYKTILAFDVNNYISVNEKGKLKGKGRFEYEPHDKYDLDVLHKNKSFLVVPKGIAAYYFQGIKPADFVKNHRNIFDFCGFARARGQWKFVQVTSSSEGITEKDIQKTLRYFVTNSGSKIIKRKITKTSMKDDLGEWEKEDEKNIQVLAGKYYITEFNRYVEKEWDQYNINYNWYVKEIQKEIDNLEKEEKKLVLF